MPTAIIREDNKINTSSDNEHKVDLFIINNNFNNNIRNIIPKYAEIHRVTLIMSGKKNIAPSEPFFFQFLKQSGDMAIYNPLDSTGQQSEISMFVKDFYANLTSQVYSSGKNCGEFISLGRIIFYVKTNFPYSYTINNRILRYEYKNPQLKINITSDENGKIGDIEDPSIAVSNLEKTVEIKATDYEYTCVAFPKPGYEAVWMDAKTNKILSTDKTFSIKITQDGIENLYQVKDFYNTLNLKVVFEPKKRKFLVQTKTNKGIVNKNNKILSNNILYFKK